MFWHRVTQDATPVIVTEQKIVLWLSAVLNKNKTMGYESLLQHIKAVSDLWQIQKSKGLVTGANPRGGAAIKGLLRIHRRRREQRRRTLYLDKGIGTLADGYRLRDVLRIANYFFEQGTIVALRSRVDFLLGHAMLCRSEDKRGAFLSNLQLYELENEGPTPCYALILNIPKSKTNQEGRRELGVAIRNKDVHQCPVGAWPSTSSSGSK